MTKQTDLTIRLDSATDRLRRALKSSTLAGSSPRITPKGATLYSVKRGTK